MKETLEITLNKLNEIIEYQAELTKKLEAEVKKLKKVIRAYKKGNLVN